MQTINLKITKKMNCGSCSGTVRATLEELDFVVSAAVDLETQTATVEVQDGACKCVKKDGKCPRVNCQCAQAAMRSALKAVGYTSEVTNCGASGAGKPCPAQALGTCTCGPDCQCGDNCDCASCPAARREVRRVPGASARHVHVRPELPVRRQLHLRLLPRQVRAAERRLPAKALGTHLRPNCQCGADCACASCPGKATKVAVPDVLVKVGAALALLTIGFIAGRKLKL
ncbi:phosphoprotein phosphatase [Aureococcus anophagefferens]|nr:phosphoprotein phosphatase [Aureococcus anophagefferens]